MRSFEIQDRKEFTSMLFIGTVFDEFRLVSAQFSTFADFSIDGRRNPGFYDSAETEESSVLREEYIRWKDARQHAFNLIRGKKAPLRFQIVFRYPEDPDTAPFPVDIPGQNAGTGFYLNLHYRNQELLCTTGVSMSGFIPGFRPDPLWDQAVERFFSSHGIAVNILA